MGKKIFVSYKYSDQYVKSISTVWRTTARDYVDVLQTLIEENDHIYKGEDDGEDLSSLQDSTIGSKLGDKIFDSSVTIVLISKGMKENKPEKDQWIPWEISYSLREQSREGRTSKTNAILAVVLPDENGSYEYYITHDSCSGCKCRTLNTLYLFRILRDNMFNKKELEHFNCQYQSNQNVFSGNPSYIYSIEWDYFIQDVNYYLDQAYQTKENINSYEIIKTIR